MEQSRVKNTSRNIVYAFLFQIIKIALVFITRIIFVKKLGAAYLGVNGLFSNVLTILSLADLGMVTALMYSLYKPLAENDEDKILKYISYFKKIYNIIALVVAVVGVSLMPFLKYLVNLPENMPNIYLYYILLLLNSVISYLFVYKTTLLSAAQKMYIINKYDTIFQIILFVLQVIVLYFTNSFTLYLVSNIICTFLGNIYKVSETEKIYPFLKEKKKVKLEKEERKKIFKNVYSSFFYKMGGIIQTNTDNILISIFVGTIVVGYYSNYSTIIMSITTFLNMIFTSLKASIGNYVVEKDRESQLKMFNILEVYNFWLVSFCSVCFFVLIPDFIEICFGKEYVLSLVVLIFAILNFYTSNIRQTLWAYRETTGIFKKTKYITLVTAIINTILSIVFGYYFGIAGIIGATVLSRMIYAWWKEPIILFNQYFKTSPGAYFITYIKRIILLGIISSVTYILCNIIPHINLQLNFIIKMIVCCILPNIMLLLIYKNNEALKYLKQILLKKRKAI